MSNKTQITSNQAWAKLLSDHACVECITQEGYCVQKQHKAIECVSVCLGFSGMMEASGGAFNLSWRELEEEFDAMRARRDDFRGYGRLTAQSKKADIRMAVRCYLYKHCNELRIGSQIIPVQFSDVAKDARPTILDSIEF